jgi:cytosine/adenosine deaminase-related metal-dependent hydrolase
VAVDQGRIVAVGGPEAPAPASPDALAPGCAIMPGLVNAHTHLELSYLHERIPPAPGFGGWVQAVMAARRQYPDPAAPAVIEPARAAIAQAVAAGTAVFGDVSNTLATVPLLREEGVPAQVFYELTGFTEPDPAARVAEARRLANASAGGGVRVSLAPHAPYSVSADLFRAIRADLDAHPHAVSSVHLGETPEELELLCHATGEIRMVLEGLGRWPAGWRPPGVGPVQYLSALGVLDARVLAVHGVQFGREDAAHLRDLRVGVVSCPRSNVYVGVGSPPLALFYETGLDVAFGTDSLASVADLNLFSELREARRIAPGVPARRLLESATLVGARALGFGGAFGTIEPGKRAALLAVGVPPGVEDVEEYLVAGVQRDAIRWL